MKIKDGTRVSTVARLTSIHGSGGKYPIWTGAIFVARRRKRDKVLTWRRDGSFGDSETGEMPSEAFVNDLKTRARLFSQLLPWRDGVSHGMEIEE